MKYIVFFTAVLFSINSAFAQCVNPNGERGQVVFNETYDVLQGCTARGWMAFHEPATHPCTETMTSPAIGETCTDGSIFAGMSPDGDVPMYTTPNDAGNFAWESVNAGPYMTFCTSNSPGVQETCQTGEENTTNLVGSAGTLPAAAHCSGLIAHGHDDWYLPAQDELNLLYTNRLLIGGFNLSGVLPSGVYTSSSETIGNARGQRFSNGVQSNYGKTVGFRIRCVRK